MVALPSLVLDADAALLPAAAELWKADASSAGDANESKAEVRSPLLLLWPILSDAVKEASPSEDASALLSEGVLVRLAFLFLPPLLLVLDEEAAAAFLAFGFFLEDDKDEAEVEDALAAVVGATSGACANGTKLLFLAADGCEAVGGLG